MKRGKWILSFAAVAAVCGLVAPSVRAASLDASDWVEHTFVADGTEGVNGFGAPTQSGGNVVAAMPTDSTNWNYSYGGGQGFEAVEHLAAVGPSLTGNLSGKTGLSATFSLFDSNLASGAAFTTADFGGETKPDGSSALSVRLYFAAHVADPGSPGYGAFSEWWYDVNPANITAMSNGTQVTITADFSDLAHWTGLNGDTASSQSVAFQTARSSVSSLGLSFGSGNFYSDGFGFSTGGTGSITLYSFNEPAAPVPLPASAWSGLALLGGLGLVHGLKKNRRQTA